MRVVSIAPFAYLPAWGRVRRVIEGRHPLGGNAVYYTTPEAVQADFTTKDRALEELLDALAARNIRKVCCGRRASEPCPYSCVRDSAGSLE